MGLVPWAAQVLGLGPRRSRAQVADEIAEELAHHLELRSRELEDQGLSPEEARARARELFGDVERVARECARIQLGGRIMLVRIQWVVIATLLGLLGVLFVQSVVGRRELRAREAALRAEVASVQSRLAEEREQAQAQMTAVTPGPSSRTVADAVAVPASREELLAGWRAELAANPEDWRHALKLFKELAALPPDEAFEVLTELWPELSGTQKEQALRAFSDHGHPRILAILDLGATDAAPGVQGRAFHYLKEYSFQNFAEDHDAYLDWIATWRDQPIAEVLAQNARAFLQELRLLSPEELPSRLLDFERLDLRMAPGVGLDLSQLFHDEGALMLVADWLQRPELEDGDFGLPFSWIEALDPDEAWMRVHVLPLADHPDEEVAIGALEALGGPGNAWALTELLAVLAHSQPGSESDPNVAIWVAARAIAEIGDPAAIPAMIGMIAANPCHDTIYGIGYNGLRELTGVSYDESHDGDWWIAWWEQNKGRFSPEVAVLPIPNY